MVDAADLLIELGVEELPAASVKPMAQYLGDALNAALKDAGLPASSYQVFATPRRIAAILTNVPGMQEARTVEKRGPAIAAAYDGEGNPSKALQGFARSNKVAVEDLTRLKTDKGEWFAYTSSQAGQSIGDVVSQSLVQIFKQMPMPKRMRWADRQEEFLRPVQWLVAMHGSTVLNLSLLGLEAGNVTLGHRFHAPEPITIDDPANYETLLHKGHVIADFDKRKKRISVQVQDAATKAGGRANLEEGLLNEVTALVEWPMAISGEFESEFLEIPKEALIQTMEENQRYFALLDDKGDLLPGFITVSNLESTNPDVVREGNERVIRPRFKDTMFFWNNDRRVKLLSHREGLKKVLFQEKLGSVYDKSERLIALSEFIAPFNGASVTDCKTAAELCKCDLSTDTVTELAKMQGIAGRYFAALEGYPQSVSAALEEQYLPKQAGGKLPLSDVGQVLAIAEKTDTLVGIYGIGLKPTGAKDPFGLRRASLGLLRLLIECDIPIDLEVLFEKSRETFGDLLNTDFDTAELMAYTFDRIKGYYQEQGENLDVVEAVLNKNITIPVDFDHRVKAVSGFRRSDAAGSLAAANKRIRNILKKADTVPSTVRANLLTESAEQNLASTLEKIASEIEPHYLARDYVSAMTATARLRDPVDAFFNDVLVMADDPEIRDNRLALLKKVGELCSRTADLSVLQLEVPA